MKQEGRRTRDFETRMGARILAARLASGMTQTQLAEAVGVTFRQVQKYESGIDRISSETIQGIAGALGVPVGVFFDEASPIAVDPERGDAHRMVAVLMRLPPRLRKKLMQLATVLTNGRKA